MSGERFRDASGGRSFAKPGRLIRLSRKIFVCVLSGIFLAQIGIGLANSNWLPVSGLLDALVQQPVTANDIKPPECSGINLTQAINAGGAFYGTTENDLILGSVGIDIVDGLSGDDCILGGEQSDQLFSSPAGGSNTVWDQFGLIAYNNQDGTQNWASDWLEIGESDGPVYGDVNVEVPVARGSYSVYADQDTWIDERNPGSNYGTAVDLKVRSASGNNRRALYHFDLAAIPANANVVAATIYFWVNNSSGAPVFLHPVTGGWSENGATWSNIAAAFNPTPAGSITATANNQLASTDITALAQQWVSGAAANHGIMLIGSPGAAETRLASREDNYPSRHAYMVIDISYGGGINTIGSDQDTWIEERNPANNYGTADELKVRASSGNNKRALYRFDLTSIPVTANVVSAAVHFWVNSSNNAPVNLHPVTGSWSENGATWSNIGAAFDPTPAASFIPGANNQMVSADITALAQQWVSGAVANHGIVLIDTTGVAETRYASKEDPNPARRPYLTIVFTRGGSVQSLHIKNAAKGASRPAELCTALSALLQFSYLRQDLDDAGDYAVIEISNDGGGSWMEIDRIAGPANDTDMQPASYDITAYASCSTTLRFLSSPALGSDDHIYFDDIKISFTDNINPDGNDVLIGGPGDDYLDGGNETDTCYGGDGMDTFVNCEIIIDP